MRVFLTGATGFVGTHMRRALLAAEHTVVGLARTEQPAETGVEWVVGDLALGSARVWQSSKNEWSHVDHPLAQPLDSWMEGCQAVVHLVGIIREQGAQTFARVHVDGTEQVLAAMRRVGVTRLLHMSALGAGPKQPTAYYRTKWMAEELVRAAGIDYTIFRPSLIFGPGDGFITTLVAQLRAYPVIPIIGNGDYTFAPVSIHAVCAAYTQALALAGPTFAKTFELCGPEVLTYQQILDLLAHRLRIRKPRVHLPVGPMSLLIQLGQFLHLPLPITRDQLAMLLLGNTCTDDSAAQVFSLPQITLAEGISEYL